MSAPRPVLLAALPLLAALGSPAAFGADGVVVVGAKPFPESRLLAEILAQHLRATTGLPIEIRDNLGGTTIAFAALRSGEIDLYPEYTGTGWAVMLEREEPARDPLRAWVEVSRVFAARWDLVWAPPLGFENTYALAMRRDVAERLGVVRISDLAAHAGELRAGVSHEFLERPDGWGGLAAAYGLEALPVRGVEHGLVYPALDAGELDVVDAYSTDGRLARYPVRLLVDDQRYFPPYDAAPLVRGALLREHPEVDAALATLAWRLTGPRMQALNARVEVDGASYEEVAATFLAEEGLGGGAPAAGGVAGASLSDRAGGGAAWWLGRLPTLGSLAAEHLAMTGVAVALATLAAVPLGILITRRPRLAPLLGAAGVLQTIPGIALLALLIPVLGLGADAAVTALFLYALLPVLRNTVTGIEQVDADAVEAARGLGLTEGEVLRRVQLPLAAPTILAGIRTAAVISVGVATLAAFIGAGGLGEPIVTGLQLDDARLVLSGAIPAALLAVIVDVGLGRVTTWLTPRGLRAAPRSPLPPPPGDA